MCYIKFPLSQCIYSITSCVILSFLVVRFQSLKDCLSDIEQALKLGVPGSTKDKLIKRKQRCNEQSKLLKIDQEQQEELLTCNVFESSYVTVKSSTEKGRFIEVSIVHHFGSVLAILISDMN